MCEYTSVQEVFVCGKLLISNLVNSMLLVISVILVGMYQICTFQNIIIRLLFSLYKPCVGKKICRSFIFKSYVADCCE